MVEIENFKDIIYDERLKYLNDYKVMVELAHRYEFYFIDEPLAKYRIHGKNTNVNMRDFREEELILRKEFLRKYNNEIPKKIRGDLYFQISALYLVLGKMNKSMRYIYNAIKINPLTSYNTIYYLINSVAIRHRVINKILRYIYRMCESK